MSALRLGLLICALGLAPTASAERAPAPPPYGAAQASADTLRYSVRAGETLIVALPGSVGGTEVSYEVIQAPALSWLVDRSFMWRTLARERGTLPVRLRRVGGGAPTEVVLLVEITG